MASYTTIDRVQALCKRLPTFTASTTVTADDVASLIDGHEGELNVALMVRGFTVPVTEPAALVAWLEKVATEGVAAAVLKAWFQDAAGMNSEASWAVWEKRYQAALAMIRDMKSDLSQIAVANSGGGGVSSWTTDYAGSESPLVAEALPVFDMTTVW